MQVLLVFQKFINFHYCFIQKHSCDLSCIAFIDGCSNLRVDGISNELSSFIGILDWIQVLSIKLGKHYLREGASLLLLHVRRELVLETRRPDHWVLLGSVLGIYHLLLLSFWVLLNHIDCIDLVLLLVLISVVVASPAPLVVATSSATTSSAASLEASASLLLIILHLHLWILLHLRWVKSSIIKY